MKLNFQLLIEGWSSMLLYRLLFESFLVSYQEHHTLVAVHHLDLIILPINVTIRSSPCFLPTYFTSIFLLFFLVIFHYFLT
jgi:hypothetical protein